MDIREAIFIYSIKNALDYGKADSRSVLNKILAKIPEAKKDIRATSDIVDEIVLKVNAMDRSEIESEAKKHAGEFEEERKRKVEETSKPKMALEGAISGNFITRFPPEPSGYMHIGHAKAVFLEKEFANVYSGKINLYFDDTNPEKEKQEYVDAIKEDLEWLRISFDSEYYASDNMEIMYECASKIVSEAHGYICMCDADTIKNNRMHGVECVHRKQSREENMAYWKKMMDGSFNENEAVLRLASNMKSANSAMRDPTLFRIKKERHYRQGNKYSAWPTYDFNTPIIDSIKGVTDVIRSKEYELRDELYYRILDLLGFRKPILHSIARLEIEGNITSKRKQNELIKEGFISGYDDPRLATIAALRKRGIEPSAIREFVLRFGMSKADSVVPMEMLLAENRKIIDRKAKRLFLVENPVKIIVEDKTESAVKLRLHPNQDLGYKEYVVGNELLIDGSDAKSLKQGGTLRLKDLFAVEIMSTDGNIICRTAADSKENLKIVQWVDAKKNVKCTLRKIGHLMSGDKINIKSIEDSEGYAEEYAANIKDGEFVQFERVGFFKLADSKHMLFTSL